MTGKETGLHSPQNQHITNLSMLNASLTYYMQATWFAVFLPYNLTALLINSVWFAAVRAEAENINRRLRPEL